MQIKTKSDSPHTSKKWFNKSLSLQTIYLQNQIVLDHRNREKIEYVDSDRHPYHNN